MHRSRNALCATSAGPPSNREPVASPPAAQDLERWTAQGAARQPAHGVSMLARRPSPLPAPERQALGVVPAVEHASRHRVDRAALLLHPSALAGCSASALDLLRAGCGLGPGPGGAEDSPLSLPLSGTGRRAVSCSYTLPQVDENSVRLRPSSCKRIERRCSNLHVVNALLRLPNQQRIGQRAVPDRCGMLVHIRVRLASKLLHVELLPKRLHPLLGS